MVIYGIVGSDGFFEKIMQGPSMPAGAQPVTAADAMMMNDNGGCSVYKPDGKGGVVLDQTAIDSRDLAKYQREGPVKIDTAAENARLRYVTPGAAQEAVYIEKAAQAADYKAQGYPTIPTPSPWPLLTDEAQATGVTEKTLADAILAQKAVWISIAANIEAIRMKAKKALAAATDPTTAQSIIARAQTALMNA